jgi:hypothetical protein
VKNGFIEKFILKWGNNAFSSIQNEPRQMCYKTINSYSTITNNFL